MESTLTTNKSALREDVTNNTHRTDKDDLLRIKAAIDQQKQLFNERDVLWLQIEQINNRSWPNIVFAIPLGIFLLINAIWISPFLDYSRVMTVMSSDVIFGTRLVVVIQDILFFSSLGITGFMIYKRLAKKSHLQKLEEEIASFYTKCDAKKIPYELFHPYTLEQLVTLTGDGFTLYQAIDELRKDCEAKRYRYQNYATLISLENMAIEKMQK